MSKVAWARDASSSCRCRKATCSSGLRYDDPAYAERLGGCRELIWDIALQVLATGHGVVLDWNQWSRAQRHEWHGRAQSAGYEVMLHHIDVPVAVALRHLEMRRASATVTSHDIPEEDLQHFMTIFEAPSTDEGLRICRVSAETGQ